MKITDLMIGDPIDHPNKGRGKVIKLKPRTIVLKYKNSTTIVVLKRKDTEFNVIDL